MLVNRKFTEKIIEILKSELKMDGHKILENSVLLQYINIKTRAANSGSKSRPSLGSLYALYVLIEDYVNNNFHLNDKYENYDGAIFSNLFKRQKELPFGSKLQNHALNHRVNGEFEKYFGEEEGELIIRDMSTKHYWIREKLLIVLFNGKEVNIATAVLKIIEAYMQSLKKAFELFMKECSQILKIENKNKEAATDFIKQLLNPNTDARIFEIVSYSILKQYYSDKVLFWGWSREKLKEENLTLYKTGRTNANDGGIDFVMRPLGRFFQVTETIDAGKYFLDIDKIQRYPLTFVVKTNDSESTIRGKLIDQAKAKYGIKKIIDKYVECIEKVINIPCLIGKFDEIVIKGGLQNVIQEIMLQSRVEFHLEDEINY